MPSKFCTMTSLAEMLEGETCRTVGRYLKEMKLRSPDGKPSPLARNFGLVEQVDGPQPWIKLWLWDRERTIVLLKKWIERKKGEPNA